MLKKKTQTGLSQTANKNPGASMNPGGYVEILSLTTMPSAAVRHRRSAAAETWQKTVKGRLTFSLQRHLVKSQTSARTPLKER